MSVWLTHWSLMFGLLENPNDRIATIIFFVILGALLIISLLATGRHSQGTTQEYFRSKWIKWIVLLIIAYIAYRWYQGV